MPDEKQPLHIILLGGPGAGKGTQAKFLQKTLKLAHIASGDLFRENLRLNTELGQLARGYMQRGALVPDDVTIAMIRERLTRSDTSNGFVLDGFPRTLAQAHALDELLKETGRKLSGVLYINVSDEEIVGRLSERMVCLNCQAPYHLTNNPPKVAGVCDVCQGELYQREDDKPETVRARLLTFHNQTSPLIDYYKAVGILVDIPGEGDVVGITERLIEAARSLLRE